MLLLFTRFSIRAFSCVHCCRAQPQSWSLASKQPAADAGDHTNKRQPRQNSPAGLYVVFEGPMEDELNENLLDALPCLSPAL
ncbi:hypothetical protein B0J15DRAFT_495624 [Fusarium solani]|uniref:Uncharacterized protein n=1 Tax=Fusarium solani TaxID=169388 RepID=A0A9P9KDF4_FUSSL|nr:uncharacterized protein B0J15DRAFT_495624 [Fusarium solani]KAH7253301.1 hypothetical protein B0J15DRAFT_495624 [Fusarium solani]